jgi:tetratricopeptide (TPR) repeat protein
MQSSTQNRRLTCLICLGLALGTWLACSPLPHCGFINYDDPDYVTHNPHVKRGLTWEDLSWAFTTIHAGNWHPLAWISHMLDCQVYALNPAGHHVTNLLFHVANAILLFIVLGRLTGTVWRSALVAALFAWHPLHVESVAWISERKDVLSAFFWILTVRAYAMYVEKSKIGNTTDLNSSSSSSSSWIRNPNLREPNQYPKIKNQKFNGFYVASLFLFILALMSKPMAITLPFVLLLLDYWPLGRFTAANVAGAPAPWRRLILEKAPFFLLAAVAGVVTFFAQRLGGAVSSLHDITLTQRLANVPIAYVRYLGKTLWPGNLAIMYPLPDSWPAWQIGAAVMLLAVITVLAGKTRRSHPYFITGWLWFLGMLTPVIGFVQVGLQSMADRYTYLPLVGIFIMLVWGGAEWLQTRRPFTPMASAGVSVLLIACIALTRFQARTWTNSITLFSHALGAGAGGAVARADLGEALASSGNLEQARAQYQAALQLKPGNPAALFGLGLISSRETNADQAVRYFQSALQNRPNYPEARYHLGLIYALQGRTAEAIEQYDECLRAAPDVPEVHYSLANALVTEGKLDDAITHYRSALRLDPDAPDVHNNLGAVLLRSGHPAEAVEQFQAALRLEPNLPQAEDQLGAALQKLGRLDEARRHFAEAVRLAPDLVHARLKLGLILAELNQFTDATIQLERVTQLEPTNDAAWYNLGGIHAAQGQWDEAARDFGKVIELKPNDADAHVRRGGALSQTGQQSAAIGEYERAAALTNHRDAQILLLLANGYASTGRFAEAITAAQKAQAAATQSDLAQEAARRVESYRAGKP